MKKYVYRSYRDYVDSQKAGYLKKRDRVWAKKENILAIAASIGEAEVGLCHGVRGGQEVGWFRAALDASVLGTEIGPTDAPSTVVWDFNQPHEDWVGKFDFVYSNAFDHAFDPKITLAVWWEQVSPGGCLVVETDERNEHTGKVSKPVNKTDPIGLTLSEIVSLFRAVTGTEPTVVDLPIVTYGYRKAILARKEG